MHRIYIRRPHIKTQTHTTHRVGDIRRQDPKTGGHERGQPRATGAVSGWVNLRALNVNNEEASVVEDLSEEE